MDKRKAFISEVKSAAISMAVSGTIGDPRRMLVFLKDEFNKSDSTKNHASLGYMELLINRGELSNANDLINFIKQIK